MTEIKFAFKWNIYGHYPDTAYKSLERLAKEVASVCSFCATAFGKEVRRHYAHLSKRDQEFNASSM